MKKFSLVTFLVFTSLIFLVCFAYLFFSVFSKIGVNLSDQDMFREITSLFLASFAIVVTLITLGINLVYARNRSIVDRNSSVKPLVLMNKALPSDKFYSDYRLRLTLPDKEEKQKKDYKTFKCTVHNYGLGIAQKLVFIAEAGGRFYKAEGVSQILGVDSDVSITFLHYCGKFEGFILYLGFKDVYGNLYFIKAMDNISDEDQFYGAGGESVSGDSGVLIEELSNFVKYRRLKKAYLGNSTSMID